MCTCGRAAATVIITPQHGDVGWCGQTNVPHVKPCVFCGDADAHDNERCPDYVLNPADARTDAALLDKAYYRDAPVDEAPAEILEVAGLVFEVDGGYLSAYVDLDRTTLALRLPLDVDEIGALGAWLAAHAEHRGGDQQ